MEIGNRKSEIITNDDPGSKLGEPRCLQAGSGNPGNPGNPKNSKTGRILEGVYKI